MRPGRLLIACVLLAVLACSHEDIIPEQPASPRLRSIEPKANSVVLPPNGSAELYFSVKDPDYVISQLRLQIGSGAEPAHFRLTGFNKTAGAGLYVATLTDAGTGEIYTEQVCLTVVQKDAGTGNEALLPSAFFSVRSEQQYPGPVLETGLPVVYVDTDDGKAITSKDVWKGAGIYIRGTEAYPGLPQVLSCEIRGRGNTTWTWPKKPYVIKLEERTSILGLPKHKRWVLLANFMDRTLMRNLVSMHVASLTNLAWSPHCVHVELVLNGKHQGSYLLIEQVRIDKNRVNITEMTPEDNSGDAVTGGYLLELDFHYDNEFQWTDPHGSCWQMGGKIPFAVKSPDAQDLTDAQKSYIKKYISEVASVLYGDRFTDPENGYARYLDIDSFIDYWIVFEVMCNHELSNPGSVFFHKDRGGKLMAGPVWDFDWGVLSFSTSGGRYNLVNGEAIWYARLMQDPAFRARLKARFQELLPQLQTIPAYMDQCEKRLEASAMLNFKMWNPADDKSQNGGNIINGDENLSFHDAVTRLKSNYETHLKVIQQKL